MNSTTTAAASTTSPHPRAQRRILTVLVTSQILSGAGLAAVVTVGALLAQDKLGSSILAGLPSALFTAGSALAAIAVGRIPQTRGHRPGLAAGYLTAAVPLANRAKTQGLIAIATGGLASGLVVTAAGYPILALADGILSLATLPASGEPAPYLRCCWSVRHARHMKDPERV